MASNTGAGSGYVSSYIIEVIDKFSKEVEQFKKSMGEVESRVEKTSKAINKNLDFSRIGRSLKTVGRELSLYVSAPLAAFSVLSLKAAADVESLELSFRAFTGSNEKANKLLEQLKDLSHGSIFNLKELGTASKLLLGIGYEAGEVESKIRKLSDVSATFSLPLDALTSMLATSKELGRFDLRQARMLTSAGIPVLKELQKYVKEKTGKGFTTKQLEKFLTEGRISAKALEGIIDQITAKGGVAHNGASKDADSLTKAFLKLKNASGGFLEEFGAALNKNGQIAARMNILAENVQKFTISFKEWAIANPSFVRQLTELGVVLIALPPILLAIGKAFIILAALIKAHPLILAFTAIVASIKFVLDNQDKISAFVDKHSAGFNAVAEDRAKRVSLGGTDYSFGNRFEKKYGQFYTSNVAAEQNALAGTEVKGEATVNINVNDPGKVVKSVETTTSPFSGFNFGTNAIAARAQ